MQNKRVKEASCHVRRLFDTIRRKKNSIKRAEARDSGQFSEAQTFLLVCLNIVVKSVGRGVREEFAPPKKRLTGVFSTQRPVLLLLSVVMEEICAVSQVRQRLTLRKAYEPERLLELRAVPGHFSAGRVSSTHIGQFGEALESWSEQGKHSPWQIQSCQRHQVENSLS